MFGWFKKKSSPNAAPARDVPLTNTPQVEVKVVPRIKLNNFHQVIASSVSEPIPADALPIMESLMGDLVLTYAIDTGVSFQMLSPSECPTLGLTAERLRPLAERNAIEVLRHLIVHDDAAPAFRLACDENMAACTVLFSALWRQIQSDECGGKPVLAAFVHRDTVYFAPDTSEGLAAMQRSIASNDFNDRHALSRMMFRFDGGEWSIANPSAS